MMIVDLPRLWRKRDPRFGQVALALTLTLTLTRQWGFGLPFPLNLIMFPFTLVEWYIRYSITG